MQKKNIELKGNKGIALITLIVSVLMMIIISSIILYNTTSSLKVNNLNNMYNDIRLLGEEVLLYYSKYNELPILDEYYYTELSSNIIGDYDINVFHIIDINEIDRNIESNLEYGEDYYNGNYDGTDIYIINTLTHQIFYVKGINVNDKTYYTIPDEDEEYQVISVDEIFANPPELNSNLTPIIYNNNEIVTVSNYDKNWYNYSISSELTNWARTKTENSEMYMWVPRFAYNTSTNEIVFLKGKTNSPIQSNDISGDEWRVPDAFKDDDGNSLTGIWLSINAYYEINNVNDLITVVNNLVGKDNIEGTTNLTITGESATYYNPIIPVGFKTVQTDNASWRSNDGIHVNGWNEGLVIEDSDGNQFTWVPVDGIDVVYEKWCTAGIEYNDSNISDDALPTKVTTTWGDDEESQITKYGGFYIARYEAGIPESMTDAISTASSDARNVEGTPVSMKNQVPWNYIDYSTSKSNAERMYNSSDYVQSGLVTGTQWDTVMKWIENSGENVQTDSTSWGNYKNAAVTEITEYSTNSGGSWITVSSTTKGTDVYWFLRTGHSEYTNKKNIYDLAGNMHEWAGEIYSSMSILRGGCYTDSNSAYASMRNTWEPADIAHSIGYRCVLYIN